MVRMAQSPNDRHAAPKGYTISKKSDSGKSDSGKSGSENPSSGKSAYAGNRIAKVLARAGTCSRRDAEKYIADGRVCVNGRRLDTPAFNVTAKDHITVDDKPLAEPDPPRLWQFHKPTGLVTSARDPEGRPTVFQKLPASLPRLNSVGRLDINTEGLLLLTNDGGLKRYLELPTTGWLRRYRVRAFGRADSARLAALKDGITLDGVTYRSIDVVLERQQGSNVWLNVALREGKNREIKRVLEHLGMKVNRLIRLSFGPFQLGQLEAGCVEEIPRRILRQQLGKEWLELAEPGSTGKQNRPDDKNSTKPHREPRKEPGKISGSDQHNGDKKELPGIKRGAKRGLLKTHKEKAHKSRAKPNNRTADPDARRRR